VDIGNDVFCIEFHTKMNALNAEIVDSIGEALDFVDKNGAGLVIGNEAGGMPGARNLGASEKVISIVRKMNEQGKIIAAICAAPPKVLVAAGVLKNKSATCYPGMEKEFGEDTVFKDLPVVVDGNLITSRGVGTALAFALTIVEKLAGRETTERVKKSALVA